MDVGRFLRPDERVLVSITCRTERVDIDRVGGGTEDERKRREGQLGDAVAAVVAGKGATDGAT